MKKLRKQIEKILNYSDKDYEGMVDQLLALIDQHEEERAEACYKQGFADGSRYDLRKPAPSCTCGSKGKLHLMVCSANPINNPEAIGVSSNQQGGEQPLQNICTNEGKECKFPIEENRKSMLHHEKCPMYIDECICTDYDEEGKSPCGVDCPVHCQPLPTECSCPDCEYGVEGETKHCIDCKRSPDYDKPTECECKCGSPYCKTNTCEHTKPSWTKEEKERWVKERTEANHSVTYPSEQASDWEERFDKEFEIFPDGEIEVKAKKVKSFISQELSRERKKVVEEIDWVSCKTIPARHAIKLHLKKCLATLQEDKDE